MNLANYCLTEYLDDLRCRNISHDINIIFKRKKTLQKITTTVNTNKNDNSFDKRQNSVGQPGNFLQMPQIKEVFDVS